MGQSREAPPRVLSMGLYQDYTAVVLNVIADKWAIPHMAIAPQILFLGNLSSKPFPWVNKLVKIP